MTFPSQLTVTWGCFIDACTTRTRAWPVGVLRSSRKTRIRRPDRGPTASAVYAEPAATLRLAESTGGLVGDAPAPRMATL